MAHTSKQREPSLPGSHCGDIIHRSLLRMHTLCDTFFSSRNPESPRSTMRHQAAQPHSFHLRYIIILPNLSSADATNVRKIQGD